MLGAVLKSNLQLKKLVAELIERPEYNKDWLSVKELKEEYNISMKMLSGYRLKGLKVVQKVPNGKILVKRSELEKFLTKK